MTGQIAQAINVPIRNFFPSQPHRKQPIFHLQVMWYYVSGWVSLACTHTDQMVLRSVLK